jgi:hypothetical protein
MSAEVRLKQLGMVLPDLPTPKGTLPGRISVEIMAIMAVKP